jgi:hypothetical protein
VHHDQSLMETHRHRARVTKITRSDRDRVVLKMSSRSPTEQPPPPRTNDNNSAQTTDKNDDKKALSRTYSIAEHFHNNQRIISLKNVPDVSFNITEGSCLNLKLEKTVSIEPQNVRVTVGASAAIQKKEIATYAKIEYDVPDIIRISSLQYNVKTFSPTVSLDTAQIEVSKKFKMFGRNTLCASNVRVNFGYSFKDKQPFFSFDALPVNPVVLGVGACAVMKEIGKADLKVKREITLFGTKAEIRVPVTVKRDKRTNHFSVNTNGSILTMKLPAQAVTFDRLKKKNKSTKTKTNATSTAVNMKNVLR